MPLGKIKPGNIDQLKMKTGRGLWSRYFNPEDVEKAKIEKKSTAVRSSRKLWTYYQGEQK